MSSNKTTIFLGLLICGGVAILVARWQISKPVATISGPAKKESVFANRNNGERPAVRTTKNLRLDPKENVALEVEDTDLVQDLNPRQALDKKFRSFVDDRRKAALDIFGGDSEKMHTTIRNMLQNDEFRNLYEQRRALESKWDSANEQQKESMLVELNTVRDKYLAILKFQASNQNNVPNAGGVVITTSNTFQGTTSVNNGNGAPKQGEPPPPPVVIM